jgi:hypothetical protein
MTSPQTNTFPQKINRLKDLRDNETFLAAKLGASSSAAKESRILFKFDGNFYRQSECYDVSVNGAAPEKIEKAPCK